MGWRDEQEILRIVKEIAAKQAKIVAAVSSNSAAITAFGTILSNVSTQIATLSTNQTGCCNTINTQLENIQEELQELLNDAIHPPAVKLIGLVQAVDPADISALFQGENMAKAKTLVGADVSIQDNGTALYTLSAQDADGVTVPVPTGLPALSAITVTDPGAVGGVNLWNVVTNPADSTGLSLVGSATSPLPSGFTIPDVGVGVSAQTTFNGALVTITFPLIDVVAGPANTLVGQVSEATP